MGKKKKRKKRKKKIKSLIKLIIAGLLASASVITALAEMIKALR